MKVGSRIRIQMTFGDWQDYTVEEFRFCLGIFLDEDHRKASRFTPLCELYGPGPESESDYISNYGTYMTNEVPAWCDMPPLEEIK